MAVLRLSVELLVNTSLLGSLPPKKEHSFSRVSYIVLDACRDAACAPRPAFPMDCMACTTASITSFGFCMVVAALSK